MSVSTAVTALCWTLRRSGKGISTLFSRSEQITVDITEEVEALSKALNFPYVDVDGDEDYDEGFEDEDWLTAMLNKLSLVSDQIYI